ncbi:hypothetical protein GCM10025734_42500 [Kitasatospora paranensis]|uniref:hypothetical protein n=1 Tax=Kitasatospora paranensis TaxID=258053 RepID=UPI0031E7219B
MAEPQHTLNLTNVPQPRTRGPKNPKATWVPPLDWAAEHGPVSGAISAATGAGALALLGAATHMPDGIPLAIGAAGALGHGIGASVRRRLTGRTMATRAASWLLAGGWTTWAIATGPLSWAAAGTLAALGVGIGAMAADAAIREEAVELERMSAEAREAARKMNGEREAIAREWADRIRRVTGIDVAVFAVEFWTTGAGFSSRRSCRAARRRGTGSPPRPARWRRTPGCRWAARSEWKRATGRAGSSSTSPPPT